MSDNMTQELIKNNLYRIGMEENRYNSEEFLNTFQKSKYLPSKSYSFRQISDWSNRDRIEESNKTDQIAEQEQRELEAELGFSKFSFLISRKHRIEREPSQNSKTKKFVELSPINVKFHSQKPKFSLKKGGNTSPRKQEELSGSFYQSHYEPLSLLYQLKTKQKKQAKAKQDELPFILPQYNELKLPKTERISSIMRLMKKNQQIRVYRQRWNCPQKFQLIKLP